MTMRRRWILVTGVVALTVTAGFARGAMAAGGDAPGPAQAVDPEYTAAVQAIKAEGFARAITLLEGVVRREPGNADAHNWLAYATRRQGDPARAIPIYQRAIALDPRHRGAHEYIGEAYLALGDVARAKEHLARLDRLCFLPCAEYRDLKKAVEAYERKGGTAKPAAAR